MNNNHLTELGFRNGAIPTHTLKRKWKKFKRKLRRSKVGKGASFDWDKGYDVRDIIGPITIKNQGDNSSCSGQAGAYLIEILRRLGNIKEGSISAKSIYAPIAADGGGATFQALEQQLCLAGANLETDVPSNYITGEPLSEAMMIEKSWMTPHVLQDAFKRAGYTPLDIDVDMDSIANAIQAYGAAIWMIRAKNNGTWRSAYPQPPIKSNPNPYWAHFMCIIGAKIIDGQKTIIALQSMGPETGDMGIQYFRQDYFDSKLILECDTLINDKYILNLPESMGVWKGFLFWFRSIWRL